MISSDKVQSPAPNSPHSLIEVIVTVTIISIARDIPRVTPRDVVEVKPGFPAALGEPMVRQIACSAVPMAHHGGVGSSSFMSQLEQPSALASET